MFGKYRNQSKKACRKAVTDYEKALLRKVKSNPKAFFRYSKNKLNFKNVVPDLIENGKTKNDNSATNFLKNYQRLILFEKTNMLTLHGHRMS